MPGKSQTSMWGDDATVLHEQQCRFDAMTDPAIAAVLSEQGADTLRLLERLADDVQTAIDYVSTMRVEVAALDDGTQTPAKVAPWIVRAGTAVEAITKPASLNRRLGWRAAASILATRRERRAA